MNVTVLKCKIYNFSQKYKLFLLYFLASSLCTKASLFFAPTYLCSIIYRVQSQQNGKLGQMLVFDNFYIDAKQCCTIFGEVVFHTLKNLLKYYAECTFKHGE